MAPATGHAQRATLPQQQTNPSLGKRDVSDVVTPPSTNVAGFAAAIAILAAIIIGYIIYRLVKRHLRLRAANAPPSPSSSTKEKARAKKGGILGQIGIADSTYDHFPAFNKFRQGSKNQGIVVLPEAPLTPQVNNWRPATLTPYQPRPSSTSTSIHEEHDMPPLPTSPVPPVPAKFQDGKQSLKKGPYGYESVDFASTPPPQYGRFTHHGAHGEIPSQRRLTAWASRCPLIEAPVRATCEFGHSVVE